MKSKVVCIVVILLCVGCVSKPFQFPKITYKDTHNHDEHIFSINGNSNELVDSLVRYRVIEMQKNERISVPNVKSGGVFEFDTLFSTGGIWDRRVFNTLNKQWKKSAPSLRVIAFSVDSTLQHYTICLDTTVANSKDSVYNFHSR